MKHVWAMGLFFMTHSLLAAPLAQMNERVSTHMALSGLDCSDSRPSDEGLITDLHCEINCSGATPKSYKIKESFLPETLGLKPGNGSNNSDTILWGSLSVTLKTWLSEQCLEKAREVCGSYEKIEASKLKDMISGEWKLERFPGCKETEVTVSPFDDAVKSIRVGGMMKKVVEFTIPKLGPQEEHSNISIAHGEIIREIRGLKYGSEKCQKPIIGEVCFGDCINLAASFTQETLATPEPLGRDRLEVCGDELSEFIKNRKLSASVRQTLCEDFFWNSIKRRDGMISSCAAMRGDVDCSKL